MSLDLSTLVEQEQIKKVNENTAIKYKVVEEKIDLETLRREKEDLERQLVEKEPSEEELLKFAKNFHPFYQQDKKAIEERIKNINEILANS